MRLSRRGKKRFATWRIVIADSRKAVTAKAVDDLGWYNPHTKEFSVDNTKVKDWFSKGAQPSNALAILFERNKIEMPSWVTIKRVEPKKPAQEESPAELEVKEDAKEQEAAVASEEPAPQEVPEDLKEEVSETTEVAEEEKKEEEPEA